MLRHTFCHLPGVASRSEEKLWAAGVTTWDDALAHFPSRAATKPKTDCLAESARRLANRDAAWFASRLKGAQAWRLFHDFRDSCAYLDIETTGTSTFCDITTIALSDGKSVKTYVQGQNLADFAHDIQRFKLLVTFNGASFDLPILRRCLGCPLDHAHIDLRFVLAGLKLRGGLKACERQVGITRPGLKDVDGFTAVLLWQYYQRRKDPRALETLLAYNAQDAINLEALLVYAHNTHLDRMNAASFAANYRAASPDLPTTPYTPDPTVLARVMGW